MSDSMLNLPIRPRNKDSHHNEDYSFGDIFDQFIDLSTDRGVNDWALSENTAGNLVQDYPYFSTSATSGGGTSLASNNHTKDSCTKNVASADIPGMRPTLRRNYRSQNFDTSLFPTSHRSSSSRSFSRASAQRASTKSGSASCVRKTLRHARSTPNMARQRSEWPTMMGGALEPAPPMPKLSDPWAPAQPYPTYMQTTPMYYPRQSVSYNGSFAYPNSVPVDLVNNGSYFMANTMPHRSGPDLYSGLNDTNPPQNAFHHGYADERDYAVTYDWPVPAQNTGGPQPGPAYALTLPPIPSPTPRSSSYGIDPDPVFNPAHSASTSDTSGVSPRATHPAPPTPNFSLPFSPPPTKSPSRRKRNIRRSSSSSGSPTRGRSQTGDFVNFTPDDAPALLAGVAPSGSTKTRARRGQEAADSGRRSSRAATRTRDPELES